MFQEASKFQKSFLSVSSDGLTQLWWIFFPSTVKQSIIGLISWDVLSKEGSSRFPWPKVTHDVWTKKNSCLLWKQCPNGSLYKSTLAHAGLTQNSWGLCSDWKTSVNSLKQKIWVNTYLYISAIQAGLWDYEEIWVSISSSIIRGVWWR